MQLLHNVSVASLLTMALAAQGTITDANCSFAVTSLATSTTSTGGLANFTANGTDQAYQSWWYYRDATGVGGAFNNSGTQFGQTYVGNLATLSWTDVDALGLYDATLTIVATSTGPTSGRALQVMTIRNRTASPQTLSVFHYVDFDVNASCCGTTGDWTLPGSGPARFIVTDATGGCVEHAALNPSNYEVATFANVRTKCVNGTPLSNSGLPFAAPGAGADYTGAFEWRQVTIPPNGSMTFVTTLGHNDLNAGVTASVGNYGTGAGTVSGQVPMISSTLPVLGAPFTVSISNAAGTSATLLVGAAQSNVSLCGLTLLVNAFADVTIPLTAGAGSFPVPAVCNPALAGGSLYWQAWVINANSVSPCFPLLHTDGLRTTLGD